MIDFSYPTSYQKYNLAPHLIWHIHCKTVKARSHRAKSNAKAKTIKEQAKEVKEKNLNIKENVCFRFHSVWMGLNECFTEFSKQTIRRTHPSSAKITVRFKLTLENYPTGNVFVSTIDNSFSFGLLISVPSCQNPIEDFVTSS